MHRIILLSALAVGLCGCGMNPGTVAAPVPVKGRVTFANGKPVGNVTLSLQPAQNGLQIAGMLVNADGSFQGEAVAGKYIWVLREQPAKKAGEQGKFRAAIQAVPEKYKDIHAEHTIDVGSSELQLKVN